ncbi:MAG: hypothetical protein JWM95_2312 [Gemmatimonadetes bacterium]|nr:hypothetical protein [Gemmatimonadota bacterium]
MVQRWFDGWTESRTEGASFATNRSVSSTDSRQHTCAVFNLTNSRRTSTTPITGVGWCYLATVRTSNMTVMCTPVARSVVYHEPLPNQARCVRTCVPAPRPMA